MKNLKYIIFGLLSLVFMASCSEDENDMSAGNPVIEAKTQFTKAHFGDILPFTINVNDNVPLSTLTAKLYFGEEEVSKTVIRTKENGDYSGTIAVPFYKDIPDGTATLEFTLMDTHMTSITKSFDLPVSRADYPYLMLVTADATYPMLPTGTPYEYAATETFIMADMPAYIKTPVVDDRGNEITFGWEAGAVMEGVTAEIPFANTQPGRFSVTFNTKTYAAAPFFEILFGEQKMAMINKDNYRVDADLTKGQEITVEGITDIKDWWIDPDFLTRVSDNTFAFAAVAGKYRVTANMTFKYFIVEVMSGNSLATLQADGSGAIWVIGEGIGKPSVTTNEVTWNTDKALCMAPMGGKKYQITVMGGQTIKTDVINFKFFHQKGWGGEFGQSAISTTSDLIVINGPTTDNGNLAIAPGKTLEAGATYVFVVDVSAGNDKVVLTVTKK